jgi:hypothetical protein
LKAAGWVLSAIALYLLLAAVVLVVRSLGPQEAAGQETTIPVSPPATAPPATAPPATVPPASVPSLLPELTEALSPASAPAEPEPEGIPGLGVTDVLGQLYRFPVGGRFVCRGPDPADGEGTLWVCSAPSARPAPTHVC